MVRDSPESIAHILLFVTHCPEGRGSRGARRGKMGVDSRREAGGEEEGGREGEKRDGIVRGTGGEGRGEERRESRTRKRE